MKVFQSKRGVSPLIATVILIAFAIGIGAVLMSWSSTAVVAEHTDAALPAECTPYIMATCFPNPPAATTLTVSESTIT